MRIINASASNLVLSNQDTGSVAVNRITTSNNIDATIVPNGSAFLLYDTQAARWRIMALSVEAISMLQNGNAFGTTATLGTTDANALQFITSGANRFAIAAGATTLTGTGATTITTNNTLTLSSAAASALNVTSGTTGVLTLDSGTTGAVNLGTGASEKTITVGNTTGATTLNLLAGAGGINLTGLAMFTNGFISSAS